MATINLGAIKFNWQGAYAGGTAYAVDDVVSYNGSSYVCILASTGISSTTFQPMLLTLNKCLVQVQLRY
jgi:hypothetical protein